MTIQSIKNLKFLPNDKDPWKHISYPSNGVYFHNSTNWYFVVGNDQLHGVSGEVFEVCFKQSELKNEKAETSNAITESLFLKTIALLSKNSHEYNNLKD